MSVNEKHYKRVREARREHMLCEPNVGRIPGCDPCYERTTAILTKESKL